MSGRDEREEEHKKEGLWMKVGDGNGSGFGDGGLQMRLAIVFVPSVRASLSFPFHLQILHSFPTM